jgi:GNAT superfamily N-acetyltransferase
VPVVVNGCDLVVRLADARDVGSIAVLRALSTAGERAGSDFEERLAAWFALEGERRTTWLGTIGSRAVGMASMLEYRRMPRPDRLDSRWGYVGNMFVRAELRNRGVGSELLAAVIAEADDRRYVRLVLSPSERSLPFYPRAGFVAPNSMLSEDRLLIRPSRR